MVYKVYLSSKKLYNLKFRRSKAYVEVSDLHYSQYVGDYPTGKNFIILILLIVIKNVIYKLSSISHKKLTGLRDRGFKNAIVILKIVKNAMVKL